VVGICGFSGSGKTTLIEQLLGVLGEDGLRIGVVKHHHHAVRSDRPGSDTERLFRAGATVVSHDGECVRVRARASQQGDRLAEALRWLDSGCQLVLVEGFKGSEIAKIWLLREGESAPPGWVGNVVEVLGWSEDRLGRAMAVVRGRLGERAGARADQ